MFEKTWTIPVAILITGCGGEKCRSLLDVERGCVHLHKNDIETSGGTGGASLTSSSGGDSTGSGGTGGESPAGCSNPQLSFDPEITGTVPVVPSEADIGGLLVGRLEPFPVDVVCHGVVVGVSGLYTEGKPCLVPGAITIYGFEDEGIVPMSEPDTIDTWEMLGDEIDVSPIDGLVVLRLPITTHHAAGKNPFIGAQVRENQCIMGVTPVCDASKALRYRDGEWSLLSDDGPDAQLFFGLDHCVSESE